MPPPPNYYQLLGLPVNASTEQITAAYRTLAKQHHPDRGGDAHQFQEIKNAYATLTDPTARQQYDQSINIAPPRPIYRPPQTASSQPTSASGYPYTTPQQSDPYATSSRAPTQTYVPRRPPAQPTPNYAPNSSLRKMATKLRMVQCAIAGAVLALWYLTRATGAAASLAGTSTTQGLPHDLQNLVGRHFAIPNLVAFFIIGAVIELVLGIALRIQLSSPAPLRHSLSVTTIALVLIGEYVLTGPGAVALLVVIVASASLSCGLSVIIHGRNWLKVP